MSFLFSPLCFAKNVQKILFVCGGNTGRSPMAEGLANNFFNFPEQHYHAFSRGVNVNPKEISPETNSIKVMEELGISIKSHRATPVTLSDINSAKLVLTMTEAQKDKLLSLDPSASEKIYTLSQCANGTQQDISDAYGKNLAFYRQTRIQIAQYLEMIEKNGFHCYHVS
jgi:protein-tyrosine phosphatase